ncbi:Rne/Rng family ribonuclease [Entomobacter blattae]|nr:Rne/Rng family ribonuclease [Entomobacter blattae]
MTKNMLIDATHAEETRVVVLNGNKLEEYDVETSSKKQLKGNIYLAKVIRVEPSLQAAFVEYGGNKHGFLAFSEIHPDYYQIPVADREKLLALQNEDIKNIQDLDELDEPTSSDNSQPEIRESLKEEDSLLEATDPNDYETIGGENDPDEDRLSYRETIRFLRNYKIQEVIRRRQILLVQVVKEERGNKGAALTTYISLAGRYCVLMPNSLKGGGISRKITSLPDRKRLRDIISEIDIPQGMAMIIRTAGAQRSRAEIHKDCEYLLKQWDEIREQTMQSIAPTLIYEEASLIKRAIRDIYTRDIHSIIIDGERAWKAVREFARLIMPQNTNRIHLWKDGNQPLFLHYKIEDHLNAMFVPSVQLKSGGYIVINQTEALVAIDVNSGRSIRERGIEETALRTNLEAAAEIAHQLKLRDLAGLIVVDFIDMEQHKHNIMVERRLKEALRSDRARIQVGRISHFGLLEMSRQRLRPSVSESSFIPCPHCNGNGIIRSVGSSALHVLRLLEEESCKHLGHELKVHINNDVALYILNHKRNWLDEIESRHKVKVIIDFDKNLSPSEAKIERLKLLPRQESASALPVEQSTAATSPVRVREIAIQNNRTPHEELTPLDSDPAAESLSPSLAPEAEEYSEEENTHRRRRRRRRRNNFRGENNRNYSSDSQREATSPTSEFEEAALSSTVHETVVPEQQPAALHNNNVKEQAPYTRPQRRAPRQKERPRQQPSQIVNEPIPSPLYQGPTPAEPFNKFDIFEVMEQTDSDYFENHGPSNTSPPQGLEEGGVYREDQNVISGQAAEVPASPSNRRRTTRRRKPTTLPLSTQQSPEPGQEVTIAAFIEEEPTPTLAPKPKNVKKASSPRRKKTSDSDDLSSENSDPLGEENQQEKAAPKKTPTKRQSKATITKAKQASKGDLSANEEERAPEEKALEESPTRASRSRKRTTTPATSKTASSRRSTTAKDVKNPKKLSPEKPSTESQEEPAIKPIIIEDRAPDSPKKKGWWSR